MSAKTLTPIDPDRLTVPRIADDVVVHEPAGLGEPWVIQRGEHRHFRVQRDLAQLIQAIDGNRDHDQLVAELGPPWTTGAVGTAVRTLAGSSLLDDGTVTARRRRGTWVRFVPPLTFQFTVLRPERLLARLRPVIRLIAGRAGTAVAGLVAAGGLLALALLSPQVSVALGSPLPLPAYLGLALAVLLTTAVHELGHGAVLTYYGGRPTRMGFMLFYLSPAFFCDVSDGWRLPKNRQRVRVALAGIATQVVVAGAAALSALFVTEPSVRSGLLIFAVTTYVSGVLNLAPFVKLDGYIALMSHLDVPHLRDRAMTDARRWLARRLFGGTYGRELPELRWSVAYGLACMTFPLYIIAGAMALWVDTLQRLGGAGAALALTAVGYLLHLAGRGLVRMVREARAAGAARGRITAALTLFAAGVVATLAFLPIAYNVAGGFVTRPSGQVELVLPTSVDRADIRPGTPVTLYRAGVVVQTEVASTALGSVPLAADTASISVFLPIRTDRFEVPVLTAALPGVTTDEPVGTARLHAGDVPLGEWLYRKFAEPLWRW
ncbi:daptide biosynthesis intramembrane metalloprotease [Actinoplanes subglobosus]|uniref:Daptide biosynthesis intramembrane metalloprotease n=1 Tax=Actinoplanes subglobosus TaxID=1547892 RepID=A0ABV8ISH4_9ACTN